MRLSRLGLMLGAALLAPLGTAAQPAAGTPAQPLAPPIAFTERTLANGLRVYAIRDTSTADVSVQVWYDVGSKDDPQGRSGFAHMFEHLMFKATRNLVSEQMDRLTEDVGGYNNASTNDDYTEYHEVVPANHLERLLFAEADRMASLVVEPTSFSSERDVVKEELRQNTNARPYGKLFSLYYPAISYTHHPYARGTIGSIANLDSAQIDDVRAFHALYYRPDNAVLVVAGNFDPASLDQWVDRYFGPIERPAGAIPRVTVAEPERTQGVRRIVYEPNTPLPAVLISYPVPPDRDPDTAPLAVLNTIWRKARARGCTRRWSIATESRSRRRPSSIRSRARAIFVALAIMAGGKTAEAGEAALRREIARLRDAPVDADELAKAHNQILTANLRARETVEGRATTIAQATIIDGDPHAADRQLAEIAQVTAADVQRVARKYLRDERSATILYLPAESAPASGNPGPITVAPTVDVRPLVAPAHVALVTPASDAERIAPPPPGPPVAAAIPAPADLKLSNGMRLLVVERHALPLLTASLVVASGSAADAADRAGLAGLTAGLLTKGTQSRSATQIAQSIEALGGSIGDGADDDGATLAIDVLSDEAAPALAILADVAMHPVFAPDEIERARTQAIDGLTVDLKDPTQLAMLVATRTVFGATPYGQVRTPRSLKAITRADVVSAYGTAWAPSDATLVMVGDITPARARALAEANFAGWKAPATDAAPHPAVTAYPAPRVIVVDMPDAGQAGVVVTRPGIARGDPSYDAASLANTILGGGFSSRLNQEIRIKRGLAYGAGSWLSAMRGGGLG